MLNWSSLSVYLTFGLGAFGLFASLSSLRDSGTILPFWLCLILSIVPFTIFLHIRAGEVPDKLAKITHALGFVWYVAVAGYTFFEFSEIGYSRESVVYSVFISLGFVPCILIPIKTFLKLNRKKVI